MIKCTLDEDECIDLLTVLRVINQVNQEQVWAIGYQIGALMQRLSPANCAPIESLAQIYMHKDGFVHEKSCSILKNLLSSTSTTTTTTPTSFDSPNTSPVSINIPPDSPDLNTESAATTAATITTAMSTKTKALTTTAATTTTTSSVTTTTTSTISTTSPPTPPITPDSLNELLERGSTFNEIELVASLGIALFWALDYGIPDDEERKLSYAMEYLIYQSQSKLSLNEVLELCINRLPIPTKSHADSHYKEVCKSLINDTIELSIFLEKIYTASMVLSDITLDNCLEATNHHHHHKCDLSDEDLSELGEPLASLRALRINDWARLWMQVIRELRQRGKFKQALSVN